MATATKTRKPKIQKDLDQIITDRLLALMEEGTAPWKSPYLARGLAMSMSTGKPYRGINPFLLAVTAMEKGYTSNWWGTYGQVAQRAGMVKQEVVRNGRPVERWVSPDGKPRGVREGERSASVLLWIPLQRKATDEEVAAGADPDKPKKFFYQREFYVFNADQADWPDGLPEKFEPAENGEGFDPIDEAEAVVISYTANGGPRIVHDAQNLAFYMPARDMVNVPLPENIRGTDEYYSTLFHELTHSTGHESRLAREGITKLTSHKRGTLYAFEELVAEFGAAMLCGRVGVQDTVDNSAAYLRGWAKHLREDKTAALRAASAAQKAVDLICGTNDNESKEG